MAVESRHINATLRLTNTERNRIMTLSRIRPNITAFDIEGMAEGLLEVRGDMVGGASMIVTSELVDA